VDKTSVGDAISAFGSRHFVNKLDVATRVGAIECLAVGALDGAGSSTRGRGGYLTPGTRGHRRALHRHRA
jgi:hypothetical protein